MAKLSLFGDDLLIKDIENLKKEIRKDIVDNGLDERLKLDIAQLKRKLLSYINSAKQTIETPKTKDEPVLTTTKSEEELIKHFTGLDVNTIKKNKNFQELVDNKVAFVRKDKNMLGNDPAPHKMTPGIQYRLDMNEFDTFESQHSKAIDYFNNSLYVIELNGKRLFFANPGGHDLSQFVKVLCSKDTGDTKAARDRFESYRTGNERFRNANRAGFADWTLRKEGIDYIKKNFVNLTDVVEKIQNGQEEEAVTSANSKSGRSTTIKEFQEKVENVKDKKNLKPSTEAYLNIVKLVKNIALHKATITDGVRYSLVTTEGSSTEEKDSEFLDKVRNEIYLWEVANQEKWVSTLINKIEKLLIKHLAKR